MKKLLFIFVLSFCSFAAWAYDFSAVAPTGQTLYYTITSDSTVEVSGDTTLTGALTIPNTVVNGSATYSVTSIGDSAFCDCNGLTSVTMPNSVTDMGECAFRHCSELTTVTLSNSVTNIRKYAFRDCLSLTTITIPNSVTSIGDYAFSMCFDLTSVTIFKSIFDNILNYFDYSFFVTIY